MSADIHARFTGKNLMVVSPDVGGVVRARALAKRLDNAPLAIVDKRRERAGESEVMNIIGEVEGRFCILVDDIVDSAGTLVQRRGGADARRGRKASSPMSRTACCRAARWRGSRARELDELVITDSIGNHESIGASAQDPPPPDRAAARRGDQADRGRDVGVQPVRLARQVAATGRSQTRATRCPTGPNLCKAFRRLGRSLVRLLFPTVQTVASCRSAGRRNFVSRARHGIAEWACNRVTASASAPPA